MGGIVIVGAGECGARAAFALRERGYNGKITLIGAEPHLPYERPQLSKNGLKEQVQPKYVADAERYASARIDVLTDTPVKAIDRVAKRVQLVDGGSIAYDRLLLTTGARARTIAGTDDASRRVCTLRTHADAEEIRVELLPGRKLAIIGGGFIGLELAATARSVGADVVLIEGLPRILSRGVPAEIATVIAERHRTEGVDIRCDTKIDRIDTDESSVRILLANGQSVDADFLVVGIGAAPNTELAEAAGLQVDNGIAVDATLRTSDPDIFAAGDCCSYPLGHYGDRRVRLEAWRNAQDQGTLVAGNLLGANETVTSVPWFWSDQYDLTLQIAGLADGATVTVRRDLADGAFILFHLDDTGRLLAASGIGQGNVVARDIRLAEKLIAAGKRPDPQALISPETKLKALIAA